MLEPAPAPERAWEQTAAPQTATVTEPNGDTVTLPLSALSSLETRPRASPPPPRRSPPHPPPPRLAMEPALPQPLDLVGVHQARMADAVTVPSTAAASATGAKTSVSVKPVVAAAKAPPRAAAAPPVVVVEAAPPARTSRHAFGLTGFAFWTLFWFGLLSLCVAVNIGVRRVTRGGAGWSAQEAAEAAAEGLAVLITTTKRLYAALSDAAHNASLRFSGAAPDSAGAYGSLGQSAPRRGDAARARSAAALGLGGEDYKSGGGSRGRSRERGGTGRSSGRKERGGRRDEDAAPEEYMMASLTRGGTGGPPSLGGRSGASLGSGKERSRGRTPPPAAPPPAWEELYRRAPEVSTTLASTLLKTLGKGKKALLERSWVEGEEGALARGAGAMPKLALAGGPGGVVLSWTEARFSAPLRCEVQSVRAHLDSPQLRLETAQGSALLQPPDEASFAEWVLGLNAAFHTASCAEAAQGGAPEEWAVGKEEMEQAAIGLPWHPAVFLGHNARSGVLGAA